MGLGVVRVRAPSCKIAAHPSLELAQRRRVDLDVVLEEATEIALGAIDLVAVEEPSPNVDPVVGRDARLGLRHDPEGGEKHAVPCHTVTAYCGGKATLEALQEVQGRKHGTFARGRAVKGVGDELGQGDGRVVEGGTGGWRGVWALEEVRYETCAELGEVSTTIVRIADLCTKRLICQCTWEMIA